MALLRVLLTILTVHSSTKMAFGDITVRSNEDLGVDAVYERSAPNENLCIGLNQPINGLFSCTFQTKESTCTASCEDGYAFPGGDETITTTCQNNEGIWSPYAQLPDCEPVCKISCQNGGSCTSPGSCSCLPGFSGSYCQTTEQHCTNPPAPLKGSISCGFEGSSFVCRVGCVSGYTISEFTATTVGINKSIDPDTADTATINQEPDGYCTTWSQDQYRTFDGKIYSFHGSCHYLLLDDAADSTFQIHIMNDDDCTPAMACSRSLAIYISSVEVILRKSDDSPVVIRNSELQILPTAFDGLEIEMISNYVIVRSSYGFDLRWDGEEAFYITAGYELFTKTKGLCGTYTDDPEDDFMMRDGTISQSPTSFASEYTMNPEDCVAMNQVSYCKSVTSRDRALNLCEPIRSGAEFSACHLLVNSKPYYDACREDVCNCDLSRSDCACNAYEAYARECARKQVVVEWRKQERCPLSCPSQMVYKQCGTSCPLTCKSTTYDCIDDHCIDGCHCPDHLVFNNNACVEPSQCPCTYQKREYSAGSTISIDNGCNTCVCDGGSWDCTDTICQATCSAVGDPHYVTFDGQHYNFVGDCSYVLVESCDGLNTDYSIQVENTKCGLQGYSCTKYVIVNVGATRVKMRQNHIVSVNGEDIDELPHSAPGVFIEQLSSIYQRVILDNGFIVLWDGFVRVYVTAPSSFFGDLKTCGLCGTFDRKQGTDFRTRAGDIEKQPSSFAAKWVIEGSCPAISNTLDAASPCDIFSHRKLMAQQTCTILKAAPFDACHHVVGVDQYFEDCKYDVCANTDVNMFCASLAVYADACAKMGTPIDWRSQITECAIVCEGDQIYQECGSACKTSCAALTAKVSCQEECIAGCSCPNGQVLDQYGRCIAFSSCPCEYNGRYYNPGENIRQGCQNCKCDNGIWQCTENTCSPDEPVCGENMEFAECREPCPLTCANLDEIDAACNTVKCEPGCQCVGDFVFDGDQCVRKEDCPCYHGDRSYRNWETIMMDCNQCVCNGRKWECETKACPGICTVYGESHYTSFDSRQFEFQGECTYTMVQSTSDSHIEFSIKSQNILCGSTGVTCTKSIIFNVGSGVDKETVELVRGKTLELPMNSHFHMHDIGNYIFITIPEGVTLQWDRGTLMYIRLSPEHSKNVTGLCGNFDSDHVNDFVPSSGGPPVATATEFGDSWKARQSCPPTQEINNTCSLVPHREAWAVKKCAIIKSDIFQACHFEVPYENYYQRCVYDACGCDFGGDCECLCTAIKAYAHACVLHGIEVDWRSNEHCPMQCDGCGQWVPCTTPCPKTCDNYCCDKECEIDGCVEGCECDDGHVLDPTSSRCVPIDECPSECTCTTTTVTTTKPQTTIPTLSGNKTDISTTPTSGIPTPTTESPCDGCWSEWIDTWKPSPINGGDFEILEKITIDYPVCRMPYEIECREKNFKNPYQSTGQRVTCKTNEGLICLNSDNFGVCYNYEIRLCCPCNLTTIPPTTSTVQPTTTLTVTTTEEPTTTLMSTVQPTTTPTITTTEGPTT
ncbi:mucin-5AC-like, partial [Anneissia japonica]|uniref:mucin-5AC-like n=1 Tax=Anneissia japonica TaxID=1529436 RepID=UPI0014255661